MNEQNKTPENRKITKENGDKQSTRCSAPNIV